MKKWQCLVGIGILVALIAGCQKLGSYLLENMETKAAVKSEKPVVVVDAGHGDADPGKVGVNGVLEKDINLKIALAIKENLEKQNVTVVMTRTDDNVLAAGKTADLKKRVELINEKNPMLAVSIHQNSFQSGNVAGAQVFYYKMSEEGKRAAELIQETMHSVDSENSRQAKADTSYYLLKNTKVPLVIVECGFLSNQEEAEKLSTESYQGEMAQAVCEGIMEYLSERMTPTSAGGE